MSSLKRTIAVFFCLFIAVSAFSDDQVKRTPPEQFLNDVSFTWLICGMNTETALNRAAVGEGYVPGEISKCIEESKETLRKSYKSAIQHLSKRKDVQPMVKDLYSYAIASLDSLIPSDESQRQWKQRYNERDRKMNEMKQRIKIELE